MYFVSVRGFLTITISRKLLSPQVIHYNSTVVTKNIIFGSHAYVSSIKYSIAVSKKSSDRGTKVNKLIN